MDGTNGTEATPRPVLYVSPHPDDAVFSAGGSIARDVAAGRRVRVVTVFSDTGPGTGREIEDRDAVSSLGAELVVLGFSDAPLRHPRHRRLRGLFEPLQESDGGLVDRVTDALAAHAAAETEIIGPLGVGEHVDHQIAHAACMALRGRFPVQFYEDVPYALCDYAVARRLARLGGGAGYARASRTRELWAWAQFWGEKPVLERYASRWPVPLRGASMALAQLDRWQPSGTAPWQEERVAVGDYLDAKLAAIGAYCTQWPLFYASLAEWRQAFLDYAKTLGARAALERRWHCSAASP
ncbi:MAG TPA: PIG-L family deacetylase [Polyangia bacterium]|jgi:LmbE family N-acetylglucosaminyl deacetylase|nr:PIG-L family deacetylase [Polyangia bacterium]